MKLTNVGDVLIAWWVM